MTNAPHKDRHTNTTEETGYGQRLRDSLTAPQACFAEQGLLPMWWCWDVASLVLVCGSLRVLIDWANPVLNRYSRIPWTQPHEYEKRIPPGEPCNRQEHVHIQGDCIHKTGEI